MRFVAAERISGSPHWQAVQDLCAKRFDEHGFAVERHAYGTGVNVVGTREGGSAKDERVVVSAHYDHIADCEGADDNASGIAGVIEVARVLAQGRYDRTLVVACWDEEEWGLAGSAAYASRAREQGDRIVASFVFEMIGYKRTEPDSQEIPAGFDILFKDPTAKVLANQKRGDFLAVISDELSAPAARMMEAQGAADGLTVLVLEVLETIKTNPMLHDLQRSDHAAFWTAGYPAMMITDTSNFRNPNYHCRDGRDTPDTLDPVFAGQAVRATVSAAAQVLGIAPP
jgi:putative aminopeptidase FrvX